MPYTFLTKNTSKIRASLKPEVTPEYFVSSQVAQGLATIGDRWAFIILRDVYLGISRFEELRRSADCNRGTFSSRLQALVEKNILVKRQYQDSPPRFEYCLTPIGLDLYPVVLMMWKWELNWSTREYLPQALTHKTCGEKMEPIYRCRDCHGELRAEDTSFAVRDAFDSVDKVPARSQRRIKSEAEKSGEIGRESMHVLDCVGDRWTSLVLAAGFFGLQRFDQMMTAIKISPSVLSDRLNLLVQTGIMDRIPYQERPIRYEYHLTVKGRDLYGHTIAIHEWTERWLVKPNKGFLILKHLPCDKQFHGDVVCSECKETLHPHEVSYDVN
jgi:DNA-binding HxlR family transcriptional regulator